MPDPVTYTALEWDKVNERYYENGVDKVVLFPMKDDGTYDTGVAWSGATKITDNPSGGEVKDFYADNILYASVRTAEKPEGNIEAFTYPDEFAECDGSKELLPGVRARGQKRRSFGLAYRSFVGNGDDNMPEGSYIIHLLYGLSVKPSEKTHDTINEDIDIEPLSWDYSGVPVPVSRPGFKPTGGLEIDSRNVNAGVMDKIEKALYGETTKAAVEANASLGIEAQDAVPGSASYLPTPDQVYALLSSDG